MGNLRPFKLFSVEYVYYIEKPTKSVEKVFILDLDMTF
jgi:hypothetical protein